MSELDALHLTRRGWWSLGVLAYIAWAISAVLDGDGALTLIGEPLLVFLWVGAILAIDRWVKLGAEGPQ